MFWCRLTVLQDLSANFIISSSSSSSSSLLHVLQVPAASVPVHVRQCVVGEIKSTPETCTSCLASTFSFTSNHTACDACPANANCTGGATLVPNLQYWQSAPFSDFMVQCPNSKACEGNREALRTCKQQAYTAEDDPTLVWLVKSLLLHTHQATHWPSRVLT